MHGRCAGHATSLPAGDEARAAFVEVSAIPFLSLCFLRRSLLDETLVVVMSDFGRTPRVNKTAGRDHWIHCYSVLLVGAGIRGGTVFGASDDQAAWVKDRPVSHADIAATIYSAMGLDPHLLIQDKLGRPVPIGQYGQPIDDVLA